MRYKRQLATSALALSLFLSGHTIYAATPQDLDLEDVQRIYQRQNKDKNKSNRNKETEKAQPKLKER